MTPCGRLACGRWCSVQRVHMRIMLFTVHTICITSVFLLTLLLEMSAKSKARSDEQQMKEYPPAWSTIILPKDRSGIQLYQHITTLMTHRVGLSRQRSRVCRTNIYISWACGVMISIRIGWRDRRTSGDLESGPMAPRDHYIRIWTEKKCARWRRGKCVLFRSLSL